MKKHAIYLLPWSGLIAAGIVLGVHAQTSAPFSITIDARNRVVKSGSPVEIRVRLKNVSEQDIKVPSMYMEGLDITYRYDVRDDSDKPSGEKELDLERGNHALSHTLKPGDEVQESILLSKKYDFTQPGKYVIQLARSIQGDVQEPIVKSNKVTITVIPLDPPAAQQ